MLSFKNVNQKFPARRSVEQKNHFIDFVKNSVKNYDVNVVNSANKHKNIVIGNIANAEIILTAHYDTPASSFYPNLMLPRSPLLGILFHFSIPILLAFIAIFVAAAINLVAKMNTIVLVILVETIYFSSFYFGTRFFTNKNNYNDNTSGVCSILGICNRCNSDKVAFILFDNEERGLLGSKAFNKENAELLKNKLLINLDCVGVGENFLFICKKTAESHPLFGNLKEFFSADNLDKSIHFFPTKGSMANSDQKSFDCAIGLVACKKSKLGIFYTSRIHTNKDNLIDESNLNFLINSLTNFIEKI